MRRAEKQFSAALPPEHADLPPYRPGSLPPLTKSNPSSKKSEYENETLVAVETSTVGAGAGVADLSARLPLL